MRPAYGVTHTSQTSNMFSDIRTDDTLLAN